MPLPKPEELHVREMSEHEREYYMSFAHDLMTDDELYVYNKVAAVLRGKMKSYDCNIDMQALIAFCLKCGCIKMTELWCRRMINKFEYDNCNEKIFIIINGSKSWEREDSLRLTKIQNRVAGPAKK